MMMRPDWRIDLKWVFGLVFLASVLIACITYSARTLTSHETATRVFTAAAGGFAASQIEEAEWEAIRAEASAEPDGSYAIPGIETEVTGSELAGLSKQEAVLVAIRPVAEANYEEGSDAALALLDLQDEEGEEFSLGPLTALTRENHDALRPFLIGSLVVAVVAGTLLFAFSRGPGRAGAIAATVALGTAGFALVWTLLDRMTSGVGPEDGVFEHELGQAISDAAGGLSGFFLRMFIMTTVMTAGAVTVHFGESPARKLWARIRKSPDEQPDTAVSDEADGTGEPQAKPRGIFGILTRRPTG